MESLDFDKFFLQLTVKLAHGAIGPPVLSLVVVAPKKGQGPSFFIPNSLLSAEERTRLISDIDSIFNHFFQFNCFRSLHRPKIAEAVNDGAECASARNFIPLTEQTTCNEDDCPPDGEKY